MAVIHEELKIDGGPVKTDYPPPLETIAQNLILLQNLFWKLAWEQIIMCGGTRCFGPFAVE